ncbi:invasion associated locus B family protein [Rhodosalinus halophilus]|uniref:Invasion associated locus B family protein n=1 Tax=Rhodosalinus halophilus TaxID=2259333 RepID=A0A365UAB4_9RHOB|nr:invasion associated locus B family protein [Rhodosalinus halophilus]RBI85184.1 invasion associated locus B family protein [Rhodosalinus halophilus]
MHRKLQLLTLAALTALAAPLAAQDTDQPAAEETTEAAPGEDLSLGTTDMGSTYVQEEVGDWELQCIRTDQEEDPCTLYQLLNDQEGNPVAEVSIFRLPEGGRAEAGATVIVPLETLLTEQLRIAVDGGQGKLYPFSFCNPVGCYARIGLTASDVEAFKRGAVARLSIVPFAAPDQTVTLDLSLSGFTAGYDKVSVLQN